MLFIEKQNIIKIIERKINEENRERFFSSMRRLCVNLASYEYNQVGLKSYTISTHWNTNWIYQSTKWNKYFVDLKAQHFDDIIFGLFVGWISLVPHKVRFSLTVNIEFVSTITILVKVKKTDFTVLFNETT